MNPMDDIPQEPVAGRMAATAPARTPMSEPHFESFDPEVPVALISRSVPSAPKSAPWRPPGVVDRSGSPGGLGSVGAVSRSSSAGAIRGERPGPGGPGGHGGSSRDGRMERSASCADNSEHQLRRAPGFRNLPVPDAPGTARREAANVLRARHTERAREHREREKTEQEIQVSPQSRATATTATSAEPSSYWGLGTPSSNWNGPRQEMRARPEPTSPGNEFFYLSAHQLRQKWQAREEELANTKARAEALRVMLKQQLEERKKSKSQRKELAELAAKGAKQQEALETSQAALEKERQHRRALYDQVRRLTPKTWRRPCSAKAADKTPVDSSQRSSRSSSRTKKQMEDKDRKPKGKNDEKIEKEKGEQDEKDEKGAAKQRKTSQTSQHGARGAPAFEDIPAGVPLPRNPGSPSSPRKGPRRSASTSRNKPQETADAKTSLGADKKTEKADKAATQPGEDKDGDSPQSQEAPDNSSLQKDQLKPEAKGQPHSAASLLRSSRAKAACQTLPKADTPERGSTLCGAGPLPPTATKASKGSGRMDASMDKEDVRTIQPELEDISPALDSLKSSGSERRNLEKPQETEWKWIAATGGEQVVHVWYGQDSVQVSEHSTLTTLPREVPLPPQLDGHFRTSFSASGPGQTVMRQQRVSETEPYQAFHGEPGEPHPWDGPHGETGAVQRFKIGQFVGTLAMLLASAAICLTTAQPDIAQTEPGQTALGQTEFDAVSEGVADLKSNPVIYFDSDKYVVPSACLSAMLIGAIGATCCLGCCSFQEDCCADCCGGCCHHLWLSICAAVGCVPAGTLVSIWMSTLGSVSGGCALFVKGLVFSGCGFFGGVTLTGAAAAAGYHFCKRYNEACGGCVS
eukprot:s1568_g14.t1